MHGLYLEAPVEGADLTLRFRVLPPHLLDIEQTMPRASEVEQKENAGALRSGACESDFRES